MTVLKNLTYFANEKLRANNTGSSNYKTELSEKVALRVFFPHYTSSIKPIVRIK